MAIAEYRINDLERTTQTLRYELAELKETIFRLKGRIADLERRVER